MSLPVWVVVFGLVGGETLAGRWPFILATAGMAGLVVLRHRANLGRLFKGAEPRIGQKAT